MTGKDHLNTWQNSLVLWCHLKTIPSRDPTDTTLTIWIPQYSGITIPYINISFIKKVITKSRWKALVISWDKTTLFSVSVAVILKTQLKTQLKRSNTNCCLTTRWYPYKSVALRWASNLTDFFPKTWLSVKTFASYTSALYSSCCQLHHSTVGMGSHRLELRFETQTRISSCTNYIPNCFLLTYIDRVPYCCEQVIAYDVINKWRTWNVGELIFKSAHLCNIIWAVDNDLYKC